jgi:hypothetical protein
MDADRQVQTPLSEHEELYNQMMLNPQNKPAIVKALRQHPKRVPEPQSMKPGFMPKKTENDDKDPNI